MSPRRNGGRRHDRHRAGDALVRDEVDAGDLPDGLEHGPDLDVVEIDGDQLIGVREVRFDTVGGTLSRLVVRRETRPCRRVRLPGRGFGSLDGRSLLSPWLLAYCCRERERDRRSRVGFGRPSFCGVAFGLRRRVPVRHDFGGRWKRWRRGCRLRLDRHTIVSRSAVGRARLLARELGRMVLAARRGLRTGFTARSEYGDRVQRQRQRGRHEGGWVKLKAVSGPCRLVLLGLQGALPCIDSQTRLTHLGALLQIEG